MTAKPRQFRPGDRMDHEVHDLLAWCQTNSYTDILRQAVHALWMVEKVARQAKITEPGHVAITHRITVNTVQLPRWAKIGAAVYWSPQPKSLPYPAAAPKSPEDAIVGTVQDFLALAGVDSLDKLPYRTDLTLTVTKPR